MSIPFPDLRPDLKSACPMDTLEYFHTRMSTPISRISNWPSRTGPSGTRGNKVGKHPKMTLIRRYSGEDKGISRLRGRFIHRNRSEGGSRSSGIIIVALGLVCVSLRRLCQRGSYASRNATFFYPEGITFNSPGSSEAPPWVSDKDGPYPEGVTQKPVLFGQYHSCVTPSGYRNRRITFPGWRFA